MQIPDILQENRHLGALGTRVARIAALVGGAGTVASLAVAALAADGWRRFFFSYLMSF